MSHMRYLWYVLRHKWFVFVAGRVLGVPILQLIIHDLSKFSAVEWPAYARIMPYFGRFKDAPPEWVKAFDRAWEHHWQNNPHHPEYWARHGGPVPAMPDVYTREMVADWYGAGRAQGKLDNWGYYLAHRERYPFHPITRERAERYLFELEQRGLIPARGMR